MKRIIVALLMITSIMTAIALLPLLSFAVPQKGDQCTTDYVDKLVGSDGEHYYRNGVQTSIKYNSDGTTSALLHENSDRPRQHYLIKPDGEADYYGYCIEQGVSFPDAQRYTGVGWVNDSYFSNLPSTVQTGIMLATIFGWQPGKNVPVPGCNEDDWYWATQVIIWEFQQKIRLSPTKVQGNGYVSANYFQSTLDGRPAEKCYAYILASMEKYQRIPSFASNEPTNAPLHVLTWDSSKLLWCVTVNDTNQIAHPLIADDSTLKIERNGNQYTFSTTTKLNIKTIKFKKNVPLPSHELLIWGGANRTQAIATGAADPINFYSRFRTEAPGTIEILKTSEDGIKAGFQFKILDRNGLSTNLATNQEGVIHAQLYPGEYVVSEEVTSKYKMPPNQTIRISENETTEIEFANILKKGKIQIQKKVIDSIGNTNYHENGAVFQIYAAEYGTYDDAPVNSKDEIVTDMHGIATTKELPLGNYVVHQKAASRNITLSQDIPVVVELDIKTVQLVIDNQLQKGKIQLFKMDKSKTPLAGAEFIIRTAENILQVDGSLIHVKGTLIETLITDNNGLASSDWLYPGKYEIEETKAPIGYVLPKKPIIPILMVTENQLESTFFKQVTIQNGTVEEYPKTGDENRRTNTRIIAILMLMSLIGIGVLAFMMREQNKTLH